MKSKCRQCSVPVLPLASVVLLITIVMLSYSAHLLKDIKAQLVKSNKYHSQMINFLSMLPKKICHVNGVRFYVPNYPRDLIQSYLVDTKQFYELDQLKRVEKYIKKGDVILDVGANMGNHSLYWANEGKAKKIYAFEPLPEAFDILKTNVEINNLQGKVIPLNIGLSSKKTNGRAFVLVDDNIGGTSISQDPEGNLKLERLDDIIFDEQHIDLVKIDVEGHELYVLQGARNTLLKYKPVIYIEIWNENVVKVHDYLTKMGYILQENIAHENYLYVFKRD